MPKVLIFDVFGTLVDWRGTITAELQPLLGAARAAAFADAWRAQYQPAMEEVRAGRLPFCKLDVLHRRNLDIVLREFGMDHLDELARRELNLVWHRLTAWPDVGPALQRLRQRFRLAPCSNGNISLMADLARLNSWHWDAITGAELARDYKPKPVVYLSAALAFDAAPEDTLMVAAHSADLAAAKAAGLATAFVARPDECGAGRGESRASGPVDYEAQSLTELADMLGC
jgi:2-haloacid dehalogenase